MPDWCAPPIIQGTACATPPWKEYCPLGYGTGSHSWYASKLSSNYIISDEISVHQIDIYTLNALLKPEEDHFSL